MHKGSTKTGKQKNCVATRGLKMRCTGLPVRAGDDGWGGYIAAAESKKEKIPLEKLNPGIPLWLLLPSTRRKSSVFEEKGAERVKCAPWRHPAYRYVHEELIEAGAEHSPQAADCCFQSRTKRDGKTCSNSKAHFQIQGIWKWTESEYMCTCTEINRTWPSLIDQTISVLTGIRSPLSHFHPKHTGGGPGGPIMTLLWTYPAVITLFLGANTQL